MKRLLLSVVFLGSFINSFGQSDIIVDLKIIVNRDTTFSKPVGTFQIELYSELDTFKLTTNNQGILELSSRDGLQIIKVNQYYTYKVYKRERYIGEDRFSTHVDASTRIIRDLSEFKSFCGQTYDPISFIDNTLELSAQGLADYKHLSCIIHDQENMEIEICGNYNTLTSPELAMNRSQIIRDSLLAEGVFPDRIKLAKPQLNDSSNKVSYRILSFDYTPCTGGSIVNFDKATNTIVETRCDSIHFIAKFIKLQKNDFAVIGIYTDREDPSNKQKAITRAEVVLAKLIALGIDKKRLKVSTSYHKPPRLDDHHDWPFYPESYTYEIGVYVNGDY